MKSGDTVCNEASTAWAISRPGLSTRSPRIVRAETISQDISPRLLPGADVVASQAAWAYRQKLAAAGGVYVCCLTRSV